MIHALVALFALTAMEIVLGIDNIVFISVATSRLPKEQQATARFWGLAAAMGTRILLLLCIGWIVTLTKPLFLLTSLGIHESWFQGLHLDGKHFEELNEISIRDLILLIGGLFLIRSSVVEIHHKVEGQHDSHESKAKSFWGVIAQIGALDIIFSLDSVITAVGMAKDIWVMVTAVIIAVGVMMAFSGAVSAFVERHPTVKMLALSFLLLIGVMLLAEGLGTGIDKGYIYFAMIFSLIVEFLNLRMKAKAEWRASAGQLH